MVHELPKRVDKTWGHELWFANDLDKNYCGKELRVLAGHRCSYHYHHIKDEVFHLFYGCVLVEFGPTDALPAADDHAHRVLLLPKQRLHIPAGIRHRFTAFDEDSVIIEVSTYHREEDSIRVPGLQGGSHSLSDPRRK